MADNIYDLIMSASEPSAQEKAARMAQMLRREQTAGQLMQMHPLLRQMGSSILQGSNQGQNRLAGAADTRFGGQLRTNLQEDAQAADLDRLGRQQAFTAGENEKSRAAQARQGALNRGLQRALAAEKAKREAAKAAAKAGGAQVPAGEAAQVGQLETATKTLGALDSEWENLANQDWVPDSITQFIPGTKARRYDDVALAAAQQLGTILEGGKLTDSDLKDKYLPLMPQQGDSKERKDAKIARLNRMVADAREGKIGGLKQAGFDTSGFAPTKTEPQPTPSAPSGDLVMVIPPGSDKPVPVHRSKLQQALAAGGRAVGD